MVKTYRSAPFINKLSLIGTDFFSYIFAISVGYWLSPLNDFSSDILEIKGSIYRVGSFLLAMLASIGILWVVYRHYTYRKPFWDELRDLFFTLFVISLANLALLVFAKVPIGKFEKIFIALEHDEAELLAYWVKKLSRLNFRNVSIIPSLQGIPLYGAEVSHFFSSETIVLRIPNNLAKRSTRFVKRTFDIIVSSLLLVFLSPLFLGIWLIIKKDGGSAVYNQVRVGRNRNVFKCYKFRTMVPNSQEVLRALLEKDKEARKQWKKEFKLKNDPRITQIGHFLRKTSLDELPQLWNVLKGDMSLVGPRPVTRQELKYYGDDIIYYQMVRPGLSGLWQVSGRNDIDYATRVYLDAWYVKNWSLWNDMVILAKTVNIVLKRKGAY